MECALADVSAVVVASGVVHNICQTTKDNLALENLNANLQNQIKFTSNYSDYREILGQLYLGTLVNNSITSENTVTSEHTVTS